MRLTSAEKNLFPSKDQTQGGGGINFNNYDKIPVEMSGEDCPRPIEGFPSRCSVTR